MPNTYTLISSNVLLSSAASVTFSAIPSTYTDLVIRASARNTSSTGFSALQVRLSGDTAGNYSNTSIVNTNGTPSSTVNSAQTAFFPGFVNNSGTTANTFNSSEVYIPNYAGSTVKPISGFTVAEDNSTSTNQRAVASLWNNTSAVTSITILTALSFEVGSSFYLYGIKNS